MLARAAVLARALVLVLALVTAMESGRVLVEGWAPVLVLATAKVRAMD